MNMHPNGAISAPNWCSIFTAQNFKVIVSAPTNPENPIRTEKTTMKTQNEINHDATTAATAHIDEVKDFTAEDKKCLGEIHKVLKKHGKTEKFGVNLLHHHFPLSSDEVMLETCDLETRTFTIKPVTRADIEKSAVSTIWGFYTQKPLTLLYCLIVTLPNGKTIHVNR
jgi:hypothetical protein